MWSCVETGDRKHFGCAILTWIQKRGEAMSRESMNRFHEAEEKRLIEALEQTCRKLPRSILPASSFGKNDFPEVRLFGEIHGILDRLTRIRTMTLVPVKGKGQ